MPNTWNFGPNGAYLASWDGGGPIALSAPAGGGTMSSWEPTDLGGLAVAGLAAAALPPCTAADVGWLAWNYDPTTILNNSTIATGGLQLIRVNVRAPVSCTNVIVVVNTGGSTLTSGQNFAGLYNSAGTRIGTSADQTTPWASTGLMTMPLAGGPFALTAGFYWVALLSNGTTSPSFGRNVNNVTGLVNGALPAAAARFGSILTGQTTLPASIIPANITQGGVGLWAALS